MGPNAYAARRLGKLASADDSQEDSASDRTPVVIDAEAPRQLGDD